MIRALIRFLLGGAAFAFLLPLIPGITFHGNFVMALVVATIFSIAGWIVDLIAKILSAVFTITSLGVALLWLVPLWLLGFWLIPAVALKLVADMVPGFLTIHGWIPAIEGGLVMLVLGACTAKHPKKED